MYVLSLENGRTSQAVKIFPMLQCTASMGLRKEIDLKLSCNTKTGGGHSLRMYITTDTHETKEVWAEDISTEVSTSKSFTRGHAAELRVWRQEGDESGFRAPSRVNGKNHEMVKKGCIRSGAVPVRGAENYLPPHPEEHPLDSGRRQAITYVTKRGNAVANQVGPHSLRAWAVGHIKYLKDFG